MYWWDNPLQTWQVVKETMRRREPLRVCIDDQPYDSFYSFVTYAGYLFPLDGNKYMVVKFGKAKRLYSHPELMGLCLSGRLWIQSMYEMPEYYRKFAKQCRIPEVD